MRLPSVRKWLAWIGALGAGALVLHAADSRSLFPDPIIAKGKGFEIRQSDVEQAVISLKATMATQGQTIPPAQMSSVESRMLDRMILTRILMQRATDADKAKAREEADRFIANTRSRAPSEESYRRQLIAVGIKPEVFEARAYEQAIVETLIRREIRDTITIPDADVRAAYDEGLDALARDVRATIQKMEASGQTNNQFYADARARFADLTRANLARLDRPETVRSAVIMVHTVDTLTREPLTAEQRAEKLKRLEAARARLVAGEDFARVAREVSEDPEVQRTGGEYTSTRTSVGLPELRDALFTLPVGEVSPVLTTRQGLYLVKVLERIPAGKMPFEQVANDLREHLLNQEVEKRLPDYFDKLKREFNVEVNTTEAR
ncbi:MAG: peptidylprolyl isomerase [Verrucomicrobia bacterium]|nr:peptidylprolyl isomerase [Verrucomicrobiota bacterium]